MDPTSNLPSARDKSINTWLVIAISIVVLGVGGTLVYLFSERAKDQRLSRNESEDDRVNTVKDAFSSLPADLASPEARSVDLFFKEQGAAFNRKDTKWIIAHYDFASMIKVVQENADFPDAKKLIDYLEKNQGKMEAAMRNQFAAFFSHITYSKHRMQRLEFNRSKTLALAYLITTDADNVHTRSRVWLKQSGPSWKIYDEEELELGLRNSTIAANMMGSASLPNMQRHMKEFLTLIQALKSAEYESAREAIEKLKPAPLPSQLKGVVYFSEAMIYLSEGELDEALNSLDMVQKFCPDSIGVEPQRAAIYSLMDRHDDALAAARKFMDFLGLDPESVAVACTSLIAQKKQPEALDLLRRTLKEFPDDAMLLEKAVTLMPSTELKAVIDLGLQSSSDAEGLFSYLAEQFDLPDKQDALLTLTQSMKALHPSSEALAIYEPVANRFLLLRRAKTSLPEAMDDLRKELAGDDGPTKLTSLTEALALPEDELLYEAMCKLFEEIHPAATKEAALARARLILGICYADIDKQIDQTPQVEQLNNSAMDYFQKKLGDPSQRESYVRKVADAACLDQNFDLLTDLLESLKILDPKSPLIVEYTEKQKRAQAEEEKEDP